MKKMNDFLEEKTSKNEKKGFILYADNAEQINLLSDEEAGVLLKNLMNFVENKALSDMSPVVKMAFSFISRQVARDTEKWLEIRKNRSLAGKTAMEKRWGNDNKNNTVITNDNKAITNDNKGITKITVNVNDNVKVNVIDRYNAICGKLLPKVTKATSQREKAINARLNDYDEQTIYTVFEKAVKSSFLTGDNGNGWKASFDWLMKPNNFVKVLEGVYDNHNDVLFPDEEDVMLAGATIIPVFER